MPCTASPDAEWSMFTEPHCGLSPPLTLANVPCPFTEELGSRPESLDDGSATLAQLKTQLSRALSAASPA